MLGAGVALMAVLLQVIPEPTLPSCCETPEREQAVGTLPWIALGAGTVLLGAGLVFGISARNASSALESRALTVDEFRGLEDRRSTHGLAGSILLTSAIALALGGSLLFIFEDQDL